MNLTSFALKLNTFCNGIFGYQTSSMLGSHGELGNTAEITSVDGAMMSMIVQGLQNLILNCIYTICRFILNLIELIQYTICKILGIQVNITDYKMLDRSNPLISILTSDAVLDTFKIICGVAIVLIIIFTIFSIIRSEYKFATDGDNQTNTKSRIFGRTLRSLFTMVIFPMITLLVIILTNAILAGFNDILKNGENSTLSGQIFMASAYNANNYRNYANDDIRVPVLIDFDDPIIMGQGNAYSAEELAKFYKYFQPTGRKLYDRFADYDFESFEDTVVYRNNTIYNESQYNGFEKFVCTREQYYVMADFIDYAIKNNLKYYVKSMKDADINWKYVSSSVYDKENRVLSITYKDASNLNDGKTYTVKYTPSSDEISTPISDAIDTISALLAVGEYGNNTFNILDRLEDTINVVEWDTDKVYIRLSKKLQDSINNYPTSLQTALANGVNIDQFMTSTDKLILFERARLKYNNTLGYTFYELQQGIELPVQKYERKVYQKSTGTYITTEYAYVVNINGTYFEVEKQEGMKDDIYWNNEATPSDPKLLLDEFDDPYYTIKESDFSVDEYLSPMSDAEKAATDDNNEITMGNLSGVDLGVWYKPNPADYYKDIIRVKLNGDIETELPSGEKVYSSYNDTVTKVIKQVPWSQKLIADMQTIYKDININALIANGKWLEQLGEYVSKEGAGDEYTSNISTALIHPLGLIMSELFLGQVEYADGFNLYGSLMFNSKFDEDTIKALALSLVGEHNYFQLKYQLEYFNEMFNVFMGPVLDEIAFYENFDLLSGNEASVQLYTYKAYLASVFLSSSAAQWFYSEAMNLIGDSTFKEDIISSTGGYKYFEYAGSTEVLSEDQRDWLKELYNNYKAELEKQYVTETNPAWPEYMDALNQYIYSLGEYDSNPDDNWDKYLKNAFEGRLELVLNSLKSDEYRWDDVIKLHSGIVRNNSTYDLDHNTNAYNSSLLKAYEDLVAQVNAVTGSIANSYDAELVKKTLNEYIIEVIEATYEGYYAGNAVNYRNGRDEFIINSYSFSINAWDTFAADGWKKLSGADGYLSYINGKYGIDTNSLHTAFDNYYKKINQFVDVKLKYYQQDQSSKNAGKRDDLVETRDSYLADAKSFYKKLKDEGLSLINPSEITHDNKPLSDLTYSYNCTNWDELEAAITLIKGYVDAYNGNEEIKQNYTSYYQNLKGYFDTQTDIDKLDRYNITFGVSAILGQNADTSLTVVVNNKAYTVGQNFTQAKFLEFVLGAKYLNSVGYDTVFVADDYEGLLNFEYEYNADGSIKLDGDGKPKANVSGSFGVINNFLVELGEITATLYQMTNFNNLSQKSNDEILIGGEVLDDGTFDITNSLSSEVIAMILQDGYLAEDLVRAFFDIASDVEITQEVYNSIISTLRADKTQANEKLNTVLSYLMLTDKLEDKPKFVDYNKLTLKEFRQRCLQFLIDYEDQKNESIEQNQNRYLAVFALSSSDWVQSIGTGADSYQKGAINNIWTKEDRVKILATATGAGVNQAIALKTDKQTQATVLRLAGLENRPYTDLVGHEYSIDFFNKIPDEQNGDIFIICTFDEETKTYIPFMMSNHRNADGENLPLDEDGKNWFSKYLYRKSYSEYLRTSDDNETEVYYPIIAKGVITREGYPTAIREKDGFIEYYRNNVIIHDVSDTGLSEYFITADQMSVNYTAISAMVNIFSEIFTGKSLVEKMCETTPRFAAHTNYNFCFGVDGETVDKSMNGYVGMSYNFDSDECLDMRNLYTLGKMNIVVLIIGTVSIIMALWKALWAVTQRMYDVTLYFLMGPAVISTLNLRTDKVSGDSFEESGDDTYQRWKMTFTQKLLSVFAYAIGFNILFVVTPLVTEMTLFEDTSAFAFLPFFNKLSLGFVNEIARVVFLIASAFVTTRAAEFFAKITKTGNGFSEGANTLANVKSTVTQVGDAWSGQLVMDKLAEAKDMSKNLIPGYALMEKASGKVKQLGNKVVSKVGKHMMKAYGVPDSVAEKASKEMERQLNEKAQAKKAYDAKNAAARKVREGKRKGLSDKDLKDDIDAANKAYANYKGVVNKQKEVRKAQESAIKQEMAELANKNAGAKTKKSSKDIRGSKRNGNNSNNEGTSSGSVNQESPSTDTNQNESTETQEGGNE